MELTGGCQCGAVRYRVSGEPAHAALCHCDYCRRSSGAPMVHWAAFPAEAFELLQGDLRDYSSSSSATRSFCPTCGSGILYRNEAALPGLVDIQAGTLDDADALPPQLHIQTAERLPFMTTLDSLPAFERYPEMP